MINKREKRFVKVCPNCGSAEVGLASIRSPNYKIGAISGVLDMCKNCDYNGNMIEVEEKRLAELQSRLKKRFSQKFKAENKHKAGAGSRKAQLKIQETAFMLLALAFLFALLFIFYSNFQVKQVYTARNNLLEEQAISLLDKFMSMPEFSCLHGSCIDEDKLYALRNMSAYNDLWKGIARIQVARIYPKQETITVYEKGKPEVSYASFVPLCRTLQQEGYTWQQCSLAKLLISIENVKLERK